MKLYAITLYRTGTDPLASRIHKHHTSRTVATFEAQQMGERNGYRACVTMVDIGGSTAAVISLANNPDWLIVQPRKVVWADR